MERRFSTPWKVIVPPLGKYSFQRRNEGIGNRLRSGGVDHRQASEGMLMLATYMSAVVFLFVEYVYLCMAQIDGVEICAPVLCLQAFLVRPTWGVAVWAIVYLRAYILSLIEAF